MSLRLRRNRRGVSNIIVVVLSLVIIVAIVSNIVLWSYELNQLDWEKMKESMSITNVERVTNSSWLVAQSEYTVNIGSRTSGTYTDTQVIDSSYERFSEAASVSNTTLINAESFEGTWPPSGWTETNDWNKENDQAKSGSYSADFDGSLLLPSGDLTTSSLNCSGATYIYVQFWWYDDSLDNGDFLLKFYDGSTYDTIQDMNQLSHSENVWTFYSLKVTDSQYFISNFQVRWSAVNLALGEHAYVDVVTVKKELHTHRLDLNGTFTIDLSTYPVGYIQTVEIQLRYKAYDAGEKWYLKAYNWASSTYSDNGFNSTAGHTPTTGWDYYAVNLADEWQSYVQNNGTIHVKFVDKSADSVQTTIDIDFLGVRARVDGTRFTFENEGALTAHMVSLWIINSTNHQRYDINVFVNSADTTTYIRVDISLPTGQFTVKVVTERGNIAVYSGS